jgi:hypothetical protein
MGRQSLSFGPVVIEHWFDEPRIGYYDDDTENDDDETCAVVYPGDLLLAIPVGYYLVPFEFLREVTTQDLWDRREAIHKHIGPALAKVPKGDREAFDARYELLLELAYVDGVLMDRLYVARFHVKGSARASVFISHSSKDKQFANWLYVDLANAGHKPWLDEWHIKAGESIPTRVATGITECDYLLVVLSKNAVSSHWVEREWQTKYWDEVTADKVLVVPVLLEDCRIPKLLQTKKYADFRSSYNDGLETLLASLQSEPTKRLAARSTRMRGKSTRTGKRKL